MMWHKCLGHLHVKDLIKGGKIMHGMELATPYPSYTPSECRDCMQGKTINDPYKSRNTKNASRMGDGYKDYCHTEKKYMEIFSLTDFVNLYKENPNNAAELINQENVNVDWDNEKVEIGQRSLNTLIDYTLIEAKLGAKFMGIKADMDEEITLSTRMYSKKFPGKRAGLPKYSESFYMGKTGNGFSAFLIIHPENNDDEEDISEDDEEDINEDDEEDINEDDEEDITDDNNEDTSEDDEEDVTDDDDEDTNEDDEEDTSEDDDEEDITDDEEDITDDEEDITDDEEDITDDEEEVPAHEEVPADEEVPANEEEDDIFDEQYYFNVPERWNGIVQPEEEEEDYYRDLRG
jgi:hypothetical protein